MADYYNVDFNLDAIRNDISIGGDSDTIAAITGSIAEAYYGIPDNIKDTALSYLDNNFKEILNCFNKKIKIGKSRL